MARSTYRIHAVIAVTFIFIILFAGIAAAALLKTGDPAPDFALSSLDGKTVQLSDYRGKVVVLGLFHICEPCKQQGEILQNIGRKLEDKGVRIIGVNAEGDSRKDVQDFVNAFETPVTFPYLIDTSNRISDLYSVRNTPNIYVLDRKGIIRFKGAFTEQEQLERAIAEILK